MEKFPDGTIKLEGPADLNAAMDALRIIHKSRFPFLHSQSHRESLDTANKIRGEASRIDVLGWRIDNPDRELTLDINDSRFVIEAARKVLASPSKCKKFFKIPVSWHGPMYNALSAIARADEQEGLEE